MPKEGDEWSTGGGRLIEGRSWFLSIRRQFPGIGSTGITPGERKADQALAIWMLESEFLQIMSRNRVEPGPECHSKRQQWWELAL